MNGMTTFERQQQVLHSKFDIKTHKETFINYLEIIIDKNGECHYAIPSHNGILEMLILKKHKIDFELWDFSIKAGELCPEDRRYDYNNWLCEETECVMVWGKPASKINGVPNEKQLATLDQLKKEGLF